MSADGWIEDGVIAWRDEWTRRNGGTPVCSRPTAFRVAKETTLQSEYVPALGGYFMRVESVWDVWSTHVRRRDEAWQEGRRKQRSRIGITDTSPSSPQEPVGVTLVSEVVTSNLDPAAALADSLTFQRR